MDGFQTFLPDVDDVGILIKTIEGLVAEYDSPSVLLARPNSIFGFFILTNDLQFCFSFALINCAIM